MQTDRAAKRADRSNATDLAKHDREASLANFDVNESLVPAFVGWRSSIGKSQLRMDVPLRAYRSPLPA
jgi:hypothetical protein